MAPGSAGGAGRGLGFEVGRNAGQPDGWTRFGGNRSGSVGSGRHTGGATAGPSGRGAIRESGANSGAGTDDATSTWAGGATAGATGADAGEDPVATAGTGSAGNGGALLMGMATGWRTQNTPLQTEQRARTPAAGTLAGSTRKTV